MTPSMKAKWIAALRNGKYAQGSGVLRTPGNRFCCLGVLADLVDPTRWDQIDDASPYYWNGLKGSIECNIPGASLPEHHIDELIALNDGRFEDDDEDTVRARTFSEIADWIEENVEADETEEETAQ